MLDRNFVVDADDFEASVLDDDNFMVDVITSMFFVLFVLVAEKRPAVALEAGCVAMLEVAARPGAAVDKWPLVVEAKLAFDISGGMRTAL